MSNDDTPPGFDEDEATVIAIRHPETSAPTVIPRELALEESRAYKAYCDWLAGKKWEVIAQEHGYLNAQAAQYDIKQYVESARSLYNSFTKQQARALMMARLEELLNFSWRTASAGNLPAVNTARQLIMDMVKLGRLDEIEDDEGEEGNHTVIVAGDEASYVASLEQAAKD